MVARRIGMVFLGMALTMWGLSCARSEPEKEARDPARRIPAMKAVVSEKDQKAIPQLIEGLESDDSAVRMHAIVALEKMTGQTKGYRYYADQPERQAAADEWRKWAGMPLATTRPTTQAAPREGR